MVDIQKLSELSRIEITDDESAEFEREISSILGYVDRVQEAAQGGGGGADDGVYNVMREDDEPHERGKYTEDLLAEAPQRKDEYVQVKKIL